MDKKPESIKLKLDSPKIPARKFLRGIEAFFELLEEISINLYETRKAIKWSVTVQPGSVVINAIPEALRVNPVAISRTLMSGLGAIEKKVEQPRHFSEKALEKLKILTELSDSDGLKVSILTEKKQKEISPQMRSHIDELFMWTHSAIGTVEGQLQILAKRQHLEVEIRDDVSGRLVKCIIPQEMLEDAKEAFDRRVAATGLIRYRKDGTPISIEVSEMFRFPLNRELPSHNDVCGILGALND
jgi:hypothetical protein